MTDASTVQTLELDLAVHRGDFTLTLREHLPLSGITAVFGPSGSGKTTLLRAIAGLDSARGRIVLDGQCLLDTARRHAVPAHRRPIGMTFQDGRLFPHLSVAANLDFAWRRSSSATRDGRYRDEVIDAFALRPLLARRAAGLSGGERQRVALARTLLTCPRLLLLDEPLSALDASRKGDILPYLDGLAERFDLPTLYVTHALDEVARLADRVLVLDGGRQRLLGAVDEVLRRDDLQTITGRFDAGVLLHGEAGPYHTAHRLMQVMLAEQTLAIPTQHPAPPGQPLRLRVLARDVALALEAPRGISIRNVLRAQVVSCQPGTADSPFVEVLLRLDGQHLRSRITRAATEALALAPGQSVYALIKSVSFDRPDD